MKKILIIGIVLILAGLLLVSVVEASPPSIPLMVMGDVTINGEKTPDGTLVTGGQFSTTTMNGRYYLLVSDFRVGTRLFLKVNHISAGSVRLVDPMSGPYIEKDLAIKVRISKHYLTTSSGSGMKKTQVLLNKHFLRGR